MKSKHRLFSAIICPFLISFASCDDSTEDDIDGSPVEQAISLNDTWQIETIEGFVLEDACPQAGTGPLGELLFSICTNGTPVWEATSSDALGSCISSDFPNLPSPANNPNPDSELVRINMVAGCDHDTFSFATEAGCADGSETDQFIIEYRNGLFPSLPAPFTTYCPLVATPMIPSLQP